MIILSFRKDFDKKVGTKKLNFNQSKLFITRLFAIVLKN